MPLKTRGREIQLNDDETQKITEASHITVIPIKTDSPIETGPQSKEVQQSQKIQTVKATTFISRDIKRILVDSLPNILNIEQQIQALITRKVRNSRTEAQIRIVLANLIVAVSIAERLHLRPTRVLNLQEVMLLQAVLAILVQKVAAVRAQVQALVKVEVDQENCLHR